jgi:two-component system chemotaxis response regulator CheB
MANTQLAMENHIAMEGNALRAGVMNLGKISKYTCPDCHGVLVQIEEGPIVRFRCHTGHAFSLKSLLAQVNEAIDTGLWATLRAV